MDLARHYQPEGWKDASLNDCFTAAYRSRETPNVQDQSAILDLLGQINYRILSGSRVYLEVGGVVYRALYGGYWRSVFTGIEHYLIRCQQISGSIWNEDTPEVIDLPIVYSREGWSAQGHSLAFVLYRD
jgi:hypothetical protein